MRASVLKKPSNLRIFLILLVVTILFFIGLWMKPVPFIGMDSYSYLNYLQGTTSAIPANTPVIGEAILSVLPGAEEVLQIIMFLVVLLTSYLTAKLGELYEENYGWIAGLLMFLGIFSCTFFLKLETDLFAIPMIIASWYFLKSYTIENYSYFFDKNLIISISLLVLAGLTWKFAIYFVPFFILLSRGHIYYILAMAPAFVFFDTFIKGLVPILDTGLENFVGEQIILLGALDVIFLGYVFSKQNRIHEIENEFWMAFVLALVNLKLSIILLFFVIINASSTFYKLENQKLLTIALTFLIMLVGIGYIIYNANPTDGVTDALNAFEEMDANGLDKKVNWGYGYYYTYLTGKSTEHYGGYGHRITDYNNTLAMTFENDSYLDMNLCNPIPGYENIPIVKCN